MVQRLGQPEIVESCEELRLYIVEMLCSVVEICHEKVGVYIDDMIKVLQRTLVDPFHDVRKVSQSSLSLCLLINSAAFFIDNLVLSTELTM